MYVVLTEHHFGVFCLEDLCVILNFKFALKITHNIFLTEDLDGICFHFSRAENEDQTSQFDKINIIQS